MSAAPTLSSFPSLAEICATLAKDGGKDMPTVRVLVLRNITIEPIEPYLAYCLLESGLKAEIVFGGYDVILQDALGENKDLWRDPFDAVVVFPFFDQVSPALADGFLSLSPPDREAEKNRIVDFSAAILAAIRRRSTALIVWNGFELRPEPALGALDATSDLGQNRLIAGINDAIRAEAARRGGVVFADLNLCLARVGAAQYFDDRYWHVGRAPYTREALKAIAREIAKPLRASKGRNRKCLVLDCDNTLWGGIVGEDGLAGIVLGKDHPGSAFADFQKELLSLNARGVLLAIASKNNPEDVWEVFDRHPHMLLKRDHIAAWRIDWNRKADNIRAIADELNLGLDSLVFADDSDFEIQFVKNKLPEVAAILLPADRPYLYRRILAGCGLFDTISLTKEDEGRAAAYRAETSRRRLRDEATDIDGFYRSLDMEIDILPAGAETIARVAQLTQKTNQFNLTTRRYSEEDIRALVASRSADVLCLRLRDRLGDSGLVGVAIVRRGAANGAASATAEIDTFLLSCRVLGRGVEDALLAAAVAAARRHGPAAIGAAFVPTRKNAQVARFYDDRKLVRVPSSAAPDGAVAYRLDAGAPAPGFPQHFKTVRFDIESFDSHE